MWQRGRLIPLSAGASVLLIALLGFLSYEQSKIWISSKALWTHTIAVDPDNYIGHYHLGHVLSVQGEIDTAIGHYTRAINLKGDEPKLVQPRPRVEFDGLPRSSAAGLRQGDPARTPALDGARQPS